MTYRTHNIKINKEYADSVLNGDKTFEVRYNDRGYQKGDYVIFNVVDKHGEINHELNNKRYVITYVLTGFGLQSDWCVFAIKEADND